MKTIYFSILLLFYFFSASDVLAQQSVKGAVVQSKATVSQPSEITNNSTKPFMEEFRKVAKPVHQVSKKKTSCAAVPPMENGTEIPSVTSTDPCKVPAQPTGLKPMED